MTDSGDATPQQKMNPEKEQMLVESYFTQPAPNHTIPEVGVTPRAAYNVITSEMMLDGDPDKNLATFVTTHMEPEARQLIADSLHKNYIDHAEYPRTAEISKRCVRMIHNLFNGPEGQDSPGTACAGSSEARIRIRRSRGLGQVLPLLRRRTPQHSHPQG